MAFTDGLRIQVYAQQRQDLIENDLQHMLIMSFYTRSHHSDLILLSALRVQRSLKKMALKLLWNLV